MSSPKKAKALFKVGDWVTFLRGTRYAIAKIIEDRGPIGVKGRRLYRIELSFNDREPDRFEMPEAFLKAAAPPESFAKVS